jgi:membrane protease YdiL (CAAX protease family)
MTAPEAVTRRPDGSGEGGAPRSRAAPAWGGVALAGGLAFLLARPALAAVHGAVPLLAAGYLTMAAAALAVPAASGRRAPLGWAAPLALGLLAVAAATVVAGPAPAPRVGAAVVVLALLAAVAEEALFRRLLYGRLEGLGVAVAVVASAGLFALVHLPAYGTAALPVDLGAGLLLSWQRYASGTWTVPAITHAAANLLAVT